MGGSSKQGGERTTTKESIDEPRYPSTADTPCLSPRIHPRPHLSLPMLDHNRPKQDRIALTSPGDEKAFCTKANWPLPRVTIS